MIYQSLFPPGWLTQLLLSLADDVESNPYNIPNYTPIFTDRVGKLGGELLTYIKYNITFTALNITTNFNIQDTELTSTNTSQFSNIHITTRCSITSLQN